MRRNEIDYRRCATMQVRDTYKPGFPVAFLIDVYGVEPRDLQVVGPGCIQSRPVLRALERLKLDPERYVATPFDIY